MNEESNNKSETHPFGCFVPKNATKLILGSFPCGNPIAGYGEWFYCGSGRNDFWSILSKLFNLPIGTKAEKEELCRTNGIAITDVAFEIIRKKGTCADTNLNIVEVNTKPIQDCLDKGIEHVFFTSKFVEKLFKVNFPDYKGKTTALLSPAPTVNRYIGGLEEYKEQKCRKEIENPFEYKLFKYKEALTQK